MAYGAVQSLSRRGGVRRDCGWRLRVWQCHRTRNEVERGRGGGLVRWGWRALAVQGLGDLRLPDPDKDRHCAVSRRPHRPEPERLICPIGVRRSRQRMLPCTDLPAQSVADLFRHCLRQQPERLPPGRPEHFRRGSPRRRCGGIAARYNQAEGLPRSGSGGSELARLRDS